ncbi:hypothetical protein EHS25_000913 [Saitozyma podzolica]|uniref:Uncharacterized protein n=1 Tax=Saitozyma podzolica TaxID=1890683 RepID=A0A427YXL0_9TREE|nr:hypothetical protein EHS25_000913 [Saitozyma podzolica]
MTSIARPGTPFPHVHPLSYAGPSSTTYPYSPQPLHFQLHSPRSPTPPSLLKRNASSSSSTSSSGRGAKHSTSYFHAHAHAPSHSLSAPATPPLSYSRESSSSTSTSFSASSPAMPSTPLIHPLSDTDVPELSLPLKPPSIPTVEQIPLHPELNQPTPTTTSTFLYPFSTGLSMPPPPPQHPLCQSDRRSSAALPQDLSCPASWSSHLVRYHPPPSKPADRLHHPRQPQRHFTSVIDGAFWVILDQ